MTDTPTNPPHPDAVRCRRCAAAWVLPVQTAVLGRVIVLDAEPSVAGVYRLTPDGRAEALSIDDVTPGELLFSGHRCATPDTTTEG